MNFGEVPGVAVNSKGHVFVFTRSNSAMVRPMRRGRAASRIQQGNFVREIGKGLYAWSFAHSVRIDKDDNIWAIDKGSDMIVKFNPAGRVVWVFGRQQESADEPSRGSILNPPLPPVDGLFRQPTDVAWDSQGNIYITDGYVNSRVAKYRQEWRLGEVVGLEGNRAGPVHLPHSIAIDNARQRLRRRPHEPSHPGVRYRRQFPAHVLDRCAA